MQPIFYITFQLIEAKLKIEYSLGSGGGTSGRAMALCQGRPSSNPGVDSELLLINSHRVYVGAIEECILFLLTSCVL